MGTGFEGELFTQVYALAESQVQYYIHVYFYFEPPSFT